MQQQLIEAHPKSSCAVWHLCSWHLMEQPVGLCLHAVGTLMDPVYTGEPAKKYKFELDPFQKTSVACLVRAIWAPLPRAGQHTRSTQAGRHQQLQEPMKALAAPCVHSTAQHNTDEPLLQGIAGALVRQWYRHVVYLVCMKNIVKQRRGQQWRC